MAAFRFIHTSDLHLGRPFANIPEPPDGNVRGRLMEARHAAIGRIGAAARSSDAAHVLVAGDTFDATTPSPGVVVQALDAMRQAGDLTWWLLPGNHDNLHDAEPLWERIRRDAPANVRVLDRAVPVPLAPGATLLPAPVTHRAPGRDLTEALTDMASGAGELRIGLAHGGVTDFTESGASVPPDRDRSARLDYLALGDWHGRLRVGPRVQYPGSPEQDRFRHGRRGTCLAVSLDGPGAPPRVDEIETGTFLWDEADLPLYPRQDAAAALGAVLPAAGRRDILMRVRATGRAGLPDKVALDAVAGAVGAEFAHFQLDATGLGTVYETADLDEIDRGGALRAAADALRAEAEGDLPQAERAVAADALARLYAYVKEAAR